MKWKQSFAQFVKTLLPTARTNYVWRGCTTGTYETVGRQKRPPSDHERIHSAFRKFLSYGRGMARI